MTDLLTEGLLASILTLPPFLPFCFLVSNRAIVLTILKELLKPTKVEASSKVFVLTSLGFSVVFAVVDHFSFLMYDRRFSGTTFSAFLPTFLVLSFLIGVSILTCSKAQTSALFSHVFIHLTGNLYPFLAYISPLYARPIYPTA